MKTWFTSLEGTVALSLFTLLSLLGRTFLDWRYVFPEYAMGRGMEALAMLG